MKLLRNEGYDKMNEIKVENNIVTVFCYIARYNAIIKEYVDVIIASSSTSNDIKYAYLKNGECMIVIEKATIYCDYFELITSQGKTTYKKEDFSYDKQDKE